MAIFGDFSLLEHIIYLLFLMGLLHNVFNLLDSIIIVSIMKYVTIKLIDVICVRYETKTETIWISNGEPTIVNFTLTKGIRTEVGKPDNIHYDDEEQQFFLDSASEETVSETTIHTDHQDAINYESLLLEETTSKKKQDNSSRKIESKNIEKNSIVIPYSVLSLLRSQE